MSGKHSKATKIVTTFGAGLACAALAPSAEAAIISVSVSPGSVSYNPGPNTFIVTVAVNGSLSFGQYNDFVGRTFGSPFGVGTLQFRPAAASNVITAGQSFFNPNPGTSAFGTQTFGFRSADGRLGWLQVNYGGSGGSVTYLAAALNTTAGEPIHSGSLAPVPEPTSLALLGLSALAAGARGIKRLREKRA